MASKTNTVLNLNQEIEEIEKRLPSQEYTLCKGLKQPFNNTNSGSRKIMQGIQMEQATQLINPEVPIVSTGYENQFGEYNSNYIVADHKYRVLTKIPKFANNPTIHYWILLYDMDKNELHTIERSGYKHITEFYGYLYNNQYLDSLNNGDNIEPGSVMTKTISYDEYNNRAEGLNLTTMYISCEDVKEDPIVISESAARRFSVPLIEKVEVKINDNDILLNIYGEGKQYKTFPDIGEEVKDCTICAVRREFKDEEALFTQSWERLKTHMPNDTCYIAEGRVIDIDVFCNNQDKINNVMYNSQVKEYYNQTIEFAKNFISAVNEAIKSLDGIEYTMSYDLQKEYKRCLDISEGKQYIYDKVFNNIVMYIYIQQEKPLERGDKITDRYGGKGVISKIKPDHLMPHYLKNGQWYPIDVLYSKCTCFNRLNDGQVFEISITYAGWQLLEYIQTNHIDYDTAFLYIYRYIENFNPDQAYDLLQHYRFKYTEQDLMNSELDNEKFNRDLYIEQMLHDGYIMLCLEPISTKINIDKLARIYEIFPFLNKSCPICVPQIDSNGNYRMVRAYRNVSIGYKYIFRLKQFSIEKFSAVSLASINIKNENSKSRLAKMHNARFASTPVRLFGEMETSSISAHIGSDIVYEEFMLSSSSPEGRREHQKLLTGDPFEFNIRLKDDCVSLNADIGMAYMKTLGAVLRFIKIHKFERRPVLLNVVELYPRRLKPILYILPDDCKNDPKKREEYIKRLDKEVEEQENSELKDIISITPGIYEETLRERAYEQKLRDLGLK